MAVNILGLMRFGLASRSAPFFVLLFALLVAGLAQSFVSNGGMPNISWVLYAIAITLFLGVLQVMRHAPAPQLASGHLFVEAARSLEPMRLRHAVVFGAALLAGAISLAQFGQMNNAAGWRWHFASVALLLVAFARGPLWLTQRPSRQHLVLNGLVPAMLGVAVAGLALALRLHQLDQFPLGVWLDEADNANHALRMVREANYLPVYAEWTNLPAHFLYVMAFAFQKFGGDAIAMRYVPVFFGVLTVVLAFLLFRRWFGNSIGFVAAVFIAVMRWHLTFSRLAMHGITVPFFVLLVLLLLDMALARKQLAPFAWLGVAMGYALCFYTPLRVLPVVLGVFVLSLAAAALLKKRSLGRCGMAMGVAAFIIGCALTVGPFAQYALQHPDAVLRRTNEVSLLNGSSRLEKDLPTALRHQLSQQMLMFTVRGDNNGRHNLPGAPLLDPLMSLLFVLGLAGAILRVRHAANWLMLLVFGLMNLPGLLSLEIESPHALRSIGALPAVVYFACLPLWALQQTWLAWQPAPRSKWLFRFGLCALLVVTGLINYRRFFGSQQKNPAVKQAFSLTETLVAQETNRLIATNHVVVLSDAFRFQPVAEYLISDLSRVSTWNGVQPLLLEQVCRSGQELAVIAEPKFVEALQALQVRESASELQPLLSPADQSTLAWQLIIPAQADRMCSP